MPGRDRVEDASFHRFIGDLPLGPLTDRSVGACRDLAGERDELAELLWGKAGGRPGTRGVREPRLHARGCGRVRGRARQPAFAPEAGGLHIDAEVASHLGIVLSGGGHENDPAAQGDLLRGQMAVHQRFQRLSLRIGQGDGAGAGSTGRSHRGHRSFLSRPS